MSLTLLAYVISLLGEVETIASIVIWFTLIVVLLPLVIFPITLEAISDLNTENYIRLKKLLLKYLKFVLFPALILVVILPNKNEMYVMAGISLGERILNTEKGNELMDKGYQALILKIDEANKQELTEEDTSE